MTKKASSNTISLNRRLGTCRSKSKKQMTKIQRWSAKEVIN